MHYIDTADTYIALHCDNGKMLSSVEAISIAHVNDESRVNMNKTHVSVYDIRSTARRYLSAAF